MAIIKKITQSIDESSSSSARGISSFLSTRARKKAAEDERVITARQFGLNSIYDKFSDVLSYADFVRIVPYVEKYVSNVVLTETIFKELSLYIPYLATFTYPEFIELLDELNIKYVYKNTPDISGEVRTSRKNRVPVRVLSFLNLEIPAELTAALVELCRITLQFGNILINSQITNVSIETPEYVFVKVAYSGTTDQCIVWNPVTNTMAVIIDPITEEAISFPCTQEELQNWLDITESVGNELYEYTQAGETTFITPEESPELSDNTGCGEIYNTAAYEETDCWYHGGGGDWPCTDAENGHYFLGARIEYINNDVPIGSWNLSIENNVGGNSCIRVEQDYLYEYFTRVNDDCGEQCAGSLGCYRSYDYTYTIKTPIGDMTTLEFYWHINSDGDVREKYMPFSFSFYDIPNIDWITAVYSTKTMVQIYGYHAFTATYTYDEEIENWWECTDAVEATWDLSEQFRVEDYIASCGSYEDATNEDPTEQTKNNDFTQAIADLFTAYHTVNSITDPPDPMILYDLSLTVNIVRTT